MVDEIQGGPTRVLITTDHQGTDYVCPVCLQMGTHAGVKRLIREIRQLLRAEAKTQNKLRHLQSMIFQLVSVET